MLNITHLTLTRSTTPLLADFKLTVKPGEIVTVSGASGSGKSTLLNWMIGDLDPAFQATGELWLNERRLDGLPIEQRDLGLLFQDDLLFAHLSVGQNLAFALPGRVVGSRARRQRIAQTLTDMGLDGFYERDPATLSGGQRARVSLMRTLLAEPQALLLDVFLQRSRVLLHRLRHRYFNNKETPKLTTAPTEIGRASCRERV